MPQAVVDHLEPIKIQEQHGEASAGVEPGLLHRFAQPLVEAIAIGQVCEAVMKSDVLQAILGRVP